VDIYGISIVDEVWKSTTAMGTTWPHPVGRSRGSASTSTVFRSVLAINRADLGNNMRQDADQV